jgi:hypothetical protein
VLVTETAWTTAGGTREQIADWTALAAENVWLADPRIAGVMPFQRRDAAWDTFGWAAPDGTPYPVCTRIRALRCARIAGRRE